MLIVFITTVGSSYYYYSFNIISRAPGHGCLVRLARHITMDRNHRVSQSQPFDCVPFVFPERWVGLLEPLETNGASIFPRVQLLYCSNTGPPAREKLPTSLPKYPDPPLFKPWPVELRLQAVP